MSWLTVPDIAAKHVLEFCATVTRPPRPLVVECRPLVNQPRNKCFSVVPQQVALLGGEQLIGWALWEVPGAFIEAEFHAIWQTPEGVPIDIAPRAFVCAAIAFLPDPTRDYKGVLVDNIRQATTKDRDVRRYLTALTRRFEVVQQIDLANQQGRLAIAQQLSRTHWQYEKTVQQLETALVVRYAPALGGSLK